jgi:PPOX class probable F420-dependent enzyme
VGRNTLNELPAWACDLLRNGRVGHLGLSDADGRPRVLPVTYAVLDGEVWTIIDNKPKRAGSQPARVRWLRARPHAALTVDHYDDDWAMLAWVQLTGQVEILEASAHPGAVGALIRRYPQYRIDPPPGPVLRFTVVRAIWWRATEC